jgi:antitoxin (DNA-binding transcriptional repressor) of toxin-antitoxin stability system
VITRSGKPVAELNALAATPLSAHALLSRWNRLPRLDADRLRADVDDLLDSSL